MEIRHTDSHYENELRLLKDKLLLMTGRVEGMIEDSIKCLVNRDKNLANKTINMDAEVDKDELAIDEHCLLILAKRQPMASDLRFITLSMKVVTDLERIADLASNICERAIELADIPQLKPYHDIPIMASIVQSMIRDVIDAMNDRDEQKALKVIKRDDDMDELYHITFRELFEIMKSDEKTLEQGILIQSVARYLERMGDHVTNIAEHVVYMIKGEDIRHSHLSGDV